MTADPERKPVPAGGLSNRSRNLLIAVFFIFDFAVAILIIAFFLKM